MKREKARGRVYIPVPKQKRLSCLVNAAAFECRLPGSRASNSGRFFFILQDPPLSLSLSRLKKKREIAGSHVVFLKHSNRAMKLDENRIGYDPSAGSPTETLLRLLLPLKDQVRTSFSLAVNQGRARRIAPLRSTPDEPVRRPH